MRFASLARVESAVAGNYIWKETYKKKKYMYEKRPVNKTSTFEEKDIWKRRIVWKETCISEGLFKETYKRDVY